MGLFRPVAGHLFYKTLHFLTYAKMYGRKYTYMENKDVNGRIMVKRFFKEDKGN
jgi:hypothetical protein